MNYRKLWLLLLAALLLAAPLAVARADEPAVVPMTPVTEQSLAGLAEAGNFDQLVASLKATPTPDSPAVTSLIREVERYQLHHAEQQQKQADAYKKAYDKMNTQAESGKLEEAMYTALLARDLATDKAAFLQDQKVAAAIKQAEAEAQKAEKAGDWVEVLSLYRALDDLFDDYSTYHKQLKIASKHVRVLRMYAPTELERLLRQRADRIRKNRAEEKDEEGKPKEEKPEKDEVRLDKEPWQQKLEGVDINMMTQALNQASQRHVSSRGYSQLLKGAAEAMIVLADTKALGDTFPSIKDASKLKRFRDEFARMAEEIQERKDNIGFLDASAMLDRMIAINQRTLDLPEVVAVYEMTEGGIDTLDEFSAVIWPHEVPSFARNFEGSFFGVGIQISQKLDPKSKRERLYVVSPLEDTPAYRAGIFPGDIIAKVNGQDTTDWGLDQAVREITGEEGTPVVLTIEREGKEAPLEFNLTRAKIAIESVRGWQHRKGGGWEYFIDPKLRIGYVRMSQFIPQTAGDLDAAINQMEREGGVNALILDLRFNPGGLLSSAVEVSNRFVPKGPLVSTVGPADTRTSEYRAKSDRAYRTMPVVVLINQGSASASEIVSGALQDYRSALIVGTRSFGKGSVQEVFAIDKGKAMLKLTTQYYKLPKGRIIHRKPEDRTWGVEPDLKITMTSEQVIGAIEFRQKADILRDQADAAGNGDPKNVVPKVEEMLEKSIDPQLEAGLLVLKTKLVAKEVALAQGK